MTIIPTMFLQLCEETEVNWVLVITNAEKNEGPRYLPKSEIRKDCGPTLRDFRVRGFASTKTKHQHTQQLPKLRKVTSTSGFRSSGFREYKCPNNTQQLPKMRKGKGRTHISGFRCSKLREFQCPNININKLPKMRKMKGGSRISGFRGSKLREFRCPNINWYYKHWYNYIYIFI
jgi:hypothetical protein